MEFIFPVRVYYEDTDVAGVVYYANYLKFMERGRTEWLRHLGMEQDILIEQDIAFAVRSAQLNYRQPARFNDALEVVTRLDSIRRASFSFEQQVVKADSREQVFCDGLINVACVTMSNMKPRKIPTSLINAFTGGSAA